jgi:DnaJ-domain-containing protein 1
VFSNEDAKKKILVTILRSDGDELVGNLVLPVMADLVRTMNNEIRYLEFEDLRGNMSLLLKSSIIELRTESLKQKPKLQNTKDANAEPFAMLGLKPDAPWADVRKSYVRMTKLYHPDQYSTVTLPDEVLHYMSEMFSQSNTAYNIIRSTMAAKEPA